MMILVQIIFLIVVGKYHDEVYSERNLSKFTKPTRSLKVDVDTTYRPNFVPLLRDPPSVWLSYESHYSRKGTFCIQTCDPSCATKLTALLKFGDGIMSAIDYTVKIDKVSDRHDLQIIEHPWC